ncbi:MAG: 3-phosphoserine/phosphohydroxythreonine transaminase, partial [Acidobacteriota bacterium]|nr:3-phosphoserine/phosphohydroxythreonine transaminase [Acidobacteriota bacterium]
MAHRVFNFSAGPSTLPLSVLEQVQAELLDYRGTGMSIMESSHRSPEYDAVNESAIALTREVLGLPDDFHILFLTGGASQQFAMIPMNFLKQGGVGSYVDTGTWSSKAIKECQGIGETHVAFAGKGGDYAHIPTDDELDVPEGAEYLHITTNNTIKGTQFHHTPNVKVPLIADMSSDIGSMRRDYSAYSMLYAGAQKNLGPAGVTLVAMRDELLQKSNDELPTVLNYKTPAGKKSLYNTPPSFPIYVVNLVLQWIKDQGGLKAVERVNQQKKDLVYGMIDEHPEFFRGTAEKDSRSWMNLTLRLPDEAMEKRFIAEAKAEGLGGLKGHRSVGGIRVSLYNAMPL